MKQTVELRIGGDAKARKLHAPHCRQAKNLTGTIVVADADAFEALDWQEKAACCLGGPSIWVYPHLRYNQTTSEERAYWDAATILTSSRTVDSIYNAEGWEGFAQVLAQLFTKTTDEGRTLLKPRIARALSHFTDIGVLREAIEIAAG